MAIIEDFEKSNKITNEVSAETMDHANQQAKQVYLKFLAKNVSELTKTINITRPRKGSKTEKELNHDLKLIKLVSGLGPDDFADYIRQKEISIVENYIQHFKSQIPKVKGGYTRDYELREIFNKLDILNDYKAELSTSPNANYFLASRLIASNGQAGRWMVSEFLLNNYLVHQCPPEVSAATMAQEQSE